MGSVKDLKIIRKPAKNNMGVGKFIFSDRYSVFDWGEMPDLIERKGQALCMMGAYCFERLEERGVRTHYRGVVDQKGRVARFDELGEPSNAMEINLVNVHKPESVMKEGKLTYDYSVYTSSLRNCLIPLEIIYRNGLPKGSSVFKRLDQGLIKLNDLGLDHYPKAGERLGKPILDVSTKLEDKDRYVTWEEAKGLAGLTPDEVVEVQNLLLKVDSAIGELAGRAGLMNEDGKIELGFDPERRLMVVDVVGTLDECRFTYDGLHVSKEIAREFYRKTSWYVDVEEAKKRAEKEGIEDWKKLCKSKPQNLDSALKRLISEMYMAAANAICEKELFASSNLDDVVQQYERYLTDDRQSMKI